MSSLQHIDATPAVDLAQTTRLYISPFEKSLFSVVLPPTAQKLARNISYHSIETFPEKPFAYLDLPLEEAQKLRKKFNNTILRGKKMRVEEARPAASGEAQDTSAATEEAGASQKVAKKRKREEGVLPGVELPNGRHVKRGWVSESKDKRKENKYDSFKTDSAQMLFRTKVPPNVASKVNPQEKKKKSRHGTAVSTPAEVREFTKTTKYPTFLRSSQVQAPWKGSLVFEDGKGWVDEDGTVVEAVSARPARPRHIPTESVAEPPKPKVKSVKPSKIAEPSPPDNTTSDSDDSDSTSDSGSDVSSDSSSVVSSLSSSSEQSTTSDKDDETATNIHDTADSETTTQPASSASITAHEISTAPDLSEDIAAESLPRKAIHPLEALYKRPKPDTAMQDGNPRPARINTSFSFFNNEEDDEEAEAIATYEEPTPQTPFTKRDLSARLMRSAAPTPDTAAPTGRFQELWKRGEDDDGEGQDMSDASPLEPTASAGATEREQTAFEKHFWKEQGDYNRLWKARRREVQKEQRYRANRKHTLT